MRRAAGLSFFLALALSSSRALAWDPALHIAIFESARQISPVLDTRFDPLLKQDVLEGVREADLSDKLCANPRFAAGRKDVWTAAEQALAEVRNPHPRWTSRQRARALGTYLHYVADCAAPPIVVKERLASIPFDLAIFREKAPLAEPLGVSLKQRADESFAASSGYESLTAAFRNAVNLTIEAARLAPLAPDAKEVEDRGPVFMVPVMVIAERVRGEVRETARILHAGLHVLEWTARKTPSGSMVRALVQNNLDFCVRHVFFRAGGWVGGVTASLPAQSLTVVELPGPPASPDDVVPRFVPGDCPNDGARPSISLAWRRLAAPDRLDMQFERIREYKPGEPAPEPVGTAVFVEYLESEMAAMKGLELPAFQATARDGRIDLSLRVRNRAEKKPRPLCLDLEVFSTSRRVTEIVQVDMNLSKVALGAEKTITGSVPVKTHGEFTGLRVARIQRERVAGVRRKEVAW